MLRGIDISSHNGKLNFEKLKKEIDFVIVRAGYGTKTYDVKARYNIEQCNKLGIPVGAYWFSYAHNVEGAKQEAQSCVEFLKQFNIDLPVAFDFEYDSQSYIEKWYGITPNATLLCNMANAFFDVIIAGGYTPMLYTNIDYINRGFKKIINNQALWLAQWGVTKPAYECLIWQKTDKHKIAGNDCNFDLNYMYKDIPNTKPAKEVTELNDSDIQDIFYYLINDYYLPVAKDVINGKYGNGAERKKNLREAGYDAALVQCVVNKII